MRPGLRGYHPDLEFKGLLDKLQDLFQRGPNLERRLLMALTQNVQRLLDEVAETKTVVQSIKKGQEVTTQMIADLKAKVAELQAKLDAGGTIGAEDLAGIDTAVADLDAANEELKTAVPANTEPTP